MVKLRTSQKEILSYRGGMMGIAAVPGSGKTWTLSLLTSEIIARGGLLDDQEVLVVTLVNSAVDNFYHRIGEFVREYNLIPNLGYRVRTLHGLAHDIVRERPDLVGLSDDFQIIADRETDAIRREVARSWIQSNPYALDEYLAEGQDDGYRDWLRRTPLPELAQSVCLSFIRYAKDKQLSPAKLAERLDSLPVPLPLAEMGLEMYKDYQHALAYRGGLDFDDLIGFALLCLHSEDDYLHRLRYQWPYVLEDEAQDSSFLQEQILASLVGDDGNWVRVGDPNQAIFETFTTADPKYLRDFIQREDVVERELPVSGRSTSSVVYLANQLVEWVQESYPIEVVRNALGGPPYIQLTELDDPQPNPKDDPSKIHLVTDKFTPQDEILAVANSLERWLPENRDTTVAVLVPRNNRGFEVVDELRSRDIECVDSLLRSTSSTRSSAGVLANLMLYLGDPASNSKLARLYKVWRRAEREDKDAWRVVKRTSELIHKAGNVEDFIWPERGVDWLDELLEQDLPEDLYSSLSEFREYVRRWLASVTLPIDQLLLSVSQDLLSEPTDLALSHKLAVLLRQASQSNPSWRMPELTQELGVIARNERRFLGFSDDDSGFDPDKYKGIVVVSTMHKAKGLEWDRVYMMSANEYNFPSGMGEGDYIAEKKYIRDHLNIEAESLEQMDVALSTDDYAWYEEGHASQQARLDYVRERLRLFYVAVTRARSELVVTSNSGRKGNSNPARPFLELNEIWQKYEQMNGRAHEAS